MAADQYVPGGYTEFHEEIYNGIRFSSWRRILYPHAY